jgi:transcriptional regulator with XRE-family HTH domain
MTSLDNLRHILPPKQAAFHYGNNFQALRGMFRLTQKDIASKVGISQKAYSRLEQKKEPPNQEILQKLLEVFDNCKKELIALQKNASIDTETAFPSFEAFSEIILRELKNEFDRHLCTQIMTENVEIQISIKILHK